MSNDDQSVQDFIAKTLHSLLYLEEFVFSRNKFKPSDNTELELADAVVMLGDVLIIFQIKERNKAEVFGENAEQKWYVSKVVKKATKQIRDTLSYLQAYDEIQIPNERGHTFNLAARSFRKIIKVVVYATPHRLPQDCAEKKHHVSETAGFIHILNASEYLQLGRVLRVPEELVRYFDHREEVISGFGPDAESLPEAAIVGQFISGEIGIAPTLASAEPLRHLVDDSEQWDLTPFLRGLHNSLSENQDSKQYYSILLEFAKLPRSMWRAAKDRLLLSIKKADEGKFTLPYRFCEPNTLSGFVFIPVDSEMSARPDWKKVRIDGLKNMTLGHKYDQRLETCVGCQIAKDGNYFDIQWCYVSFPWEEDHLLADALKENFPFRPVKSAVVSGYKFFADTDGAGSSPAD